MTRIAPVRLAARPASALVALALLGRGATAQSNPQSIYFGYLFNGISEALCTSGSVVGRYAASRSCTRVAAVGNLSASSLGGELRARATLTGTGAQASGSSYLQSASITAATSFQETFTFVGSVPASVVFHYALSGSPMWTRPGGDLTSYYTRADYNSTVSVTNGVGGSLRLFDERGSGTPGFPNGNADPAYVRTRLAGSITAQLRGNPVVQVGTGTQVFATMINYFGRASTGTVDVDFMNTGRIAYVQAFDASGADISQSVTVTTASGVHYAFGAPSVVPEPGTWALLGTGLAVLGGVARRRRRSA